MPPLTFVMLGSRGEDNVPTVCKSRTHQNMLCHLSRPPETGVQVPLLPSHYAIPLCSCFPIVFTEAAIQYVTNTAIVCSQALIELVIEREIAEKAFLCKLQNIPLLMFHSETMLIYYVAVVTFQNRLVRSFHAKEGVEQC